MKYRLRDLAQIKYGKDHKKLKDGNIPVYGTGGLMRKVNEYLYDGKSVLIPRKGSLNNVMYVTGKFWTVDTMFWTHVDDSKVIPKYLYYCLSKMDLESLNVGSAVPSLTTKILNEIILDIPPKEKQKEIIDKLAPIEEKVRLNNKINDNLSNIKTTIFNHMFDIKLKQYLNGTIQDIAKVTTGKRPKNKYTSKEMNNLYPIIGASKIIGYTDAFLYNESIITTGRVGTHGVIQRYREPVWVSDNSFIITSKHEDYLYELLRNFINFNALNTGSTQPLITQSDLKNIDIYIPSKKEFSLFEFRTTALTDKQFEIKRQNQILQILKSQLLSKYF